MICKRGRFVIQRHKELRDLKAELLSTVCKDVEVEDMRAVDLATQKGASSWLTVLPIRDMDFDLNKSEF